MTEVVGGLLSKIYQASHNNLYAVIIVCIYQWVAYLTLVSLRYTILRFIRPAIIIITCVPLLLFVFIMGGIFDFLCIYFTSCFSFIFC